MADLLRISLLVFLISAAFAVDITHNFSEEARDCENYCSDREYVGADKACGRGCRFFTISSFLRPNGDVIGFCKSSCVEAYGETSELLAPCHEGCERQYWYSNIALEKSPVDAAPLAEETAEKPEGLELHMATPIMQVKRIVARVVGQFHILKKSVLTYFLRDDNTIMAVESAPEVMIELAPEERFRSPVDLLGEPRQQLDQSPEIATNQMPFNMESLNPFSSGASRSDELSSEDEVRIVSLRRGRYAYLLHLLLILAAALLSLFALVYCIAAARHQKRQALKQANLSVALQSEPLKLVRPEDLTKLSLMDDDQAPPLPHKQDLAFTHANV